MNISLKVKVLNNFLLFKRFCILPTTVECVDISCYIVHILSLCNRATGKLIEGARRGEKVQHISVLIYPWQTAYQLSPGQGEVCTVFEIARGIKDLNQHSSKR
jgi:hypothetical protein